MKSLLLSLILLSILPTQAYVENIRHSYTSCLTCHHNPQGGGLLTAYGKALGHEIMYSQSFEKQEDMLKEDGKKWWAAGVDLRGMQILRDNSKQTKAVFIPMQTDLIGLIDFGTVSASLTYGTKSSNSFGERKTTSLIRQGYLKISLTNSLLIQTGKFFTPFGLSLPDHNLLVRRNLGYEQNQETKNVLFQLGSESFQFEPYAFDRESESTQVISKGYGLRAKLFLQSKHALSLSLQSEGDRRTQGLAAIFSMDFLNSALMLETNERLEKDERAYFSFARYLIEPWQGLKPFLQLEQGTSYFQIPEPQDNRWALGTQWLPREHLDLTLQVGQNHLSTEDKETLALAIFHIYAL